MKILVADRIVATSHDFPTVNCTIDPEDMRYISSLLRNNYSNTILATIRETYANAFDANKENNLSPELIEVKSPTSLDQTFSVRDYGCGLSRDQVFNLYSKFGKSTKRGSDLSIGGFGIGRFAPLSYKDSFTVTSYHNGNKSIYSLYISEENDTKIDEVFSEPTSEHNGICISVGVAKNDLTKFNEEISSFFSNFEVLPKFLNIQTHIVKPQIVASGTDWQIRKSANGHSNYSVGEQGVVMGGIYYPINPELIDFKNDDDYAWTKYLNKFVLIADIGSVSLHHSRETLEYNKTTKAYLKSRYQAFCKEFTDSIKNKIAQFDCLRDAMSYYKDISQTFPRNAFDQLQNHVDAFVFKGHKITTFNFNRATYEVDDKAHRIPVYTKLYCLSGDRVAIAKSYTVTNDENTYIVFHDLPDNTKIVPRVYELVKKYKNVVVVAHDQSIISSSVVNGVDKFKEVNRFDLVKSGYCNLSELTPVKLPSNKKASISSYTPSYFYKVDRRILHSSNSYTQEINDTSIVKLYFPISNGKPINQYSHFYHEKNKLNSHFISEIGKLFNVNIYAVSNNVAATVKFKNRADFVDVNKYVQDKWDVCSDEVKSLILEYISCKTDDAYNIMTFVSMVGDVITYQKYDYKMKFCSEFLKIDTLEFANFIKTWRHVLENLKINMSHDNETPVSICGKYLQEATEEIYKNYPMLKIHADLYHTDRNKNEVEFKTYISLINQQNSVDFSKI